MLGGFLGDGNLWQEVERVFVFVMWFVRDL